MNKKIRNAAAIVLVIALLLITSVTWAARDLNASVAKFSLPTNELALRRHVIPGTYCEAIGHSAAILGHEDGIFEVWIFPFKILYDLRLSILKEGQAHPFEASQIARSIIVRPEATTITYSDPAFTIRQTLFAPIDKRGIIILLDIDTDQPFDIIVSFFPDLNPMWPGGMGGQFCYWDDDERAYIISESRWKFSGIIGSPEGKPLSSPPAHQLATTPARFRIAVAPEKATRQFIPVVIAGSTQPRLDELKATYSSLLGTVQALYQETYAYYKNLNTNLLHVSLPNKELSRAFEWAKVAIDKGFVNNPHLGKGLVAGYGTSGVGRRPGFGWFFGGDAFINSLAINAYGDFDKVKQAFAFLQKYQRDDGKMMHELSQAGGLIPWFEEYPYGYIHGDTTPYYIALMADYLRASGDSEFIRESWNSIMKAYNWCLDCETDGDGLLENPKAGLGAAELGSLRQNIHTDIYLASVWIAALDGMACLSEALGHREQSEKAKKLHDKALASLKKRFLNTDKRMINFALTTDGGVNDEVTTWPAVPLIFEQFEPDQAAPMLDLFASSELSTDWGTRMLSNRSSAYEPLSYNNGAVWPFLTGFVSMAEYRYSRSVSAFLHLMNVARLTTVDGLGYHTELLSGNLYRPLDTSVPHQIFSSSQFCHALIRGLLGLSGDVLKRAVRFAPQLPANWDQVDVSRFRLGKSLFDFDYTNDGHVIRVEARHQGDGEYMLAFTPYLPVGSHVRSATVDGTTVEFSLVGGIFSLQCQIETVLKDRRTVEIHYEPGVAIVPPLPDVEIGDSPHGLKIINHSFSDGWHTVVTEGLVQHTYDLQLICGSEISEVDGADIVGREGWCVTIAVSFQDNGEGYVHKTIRLKQED